MTIIQHTSTICHFTKFSASESVVGETSTATGTLSNVSAGSKEIKNRYFFDDGQRDGFYDYAKLQLRFR